MNSDDDVTIGTGYPRFQLAKALEHGWAVGDTRALGRADKWQRVIESMLSGQLSVGSRKPLPDTPTWVTLEVLTGGFATGAFLAGGPMRPHEQKLAGELGLDENDETRGLLNGYFLSEDGQQRLGQLLDSGAYRVDVPEESALLVVCWLLRAGDIEPAQALLDQIIPYFDRLRFFPVPTDGKTESTEEVFLQSVAKTVQALERVKASRQLDAQTEALEIWTPLYDEAVSLALETVDGDPPKVAVDPSGKPIRDSSGRYEVNGGRPFSLRPDDWNRRAVDLLSRYRARSATHRRCKRWHDPREPFQRLMNAIGRFVANGDVHPRATGYVRLALARFIAKRGVPDSDSHRRFRVLQVKQGAGPRYHDVARTLARRLAEYPQDRGIENLESAVRAVEPAESTGAVPAGTLVPAHLARKVGRAQLATIQDLIRWKYITSADRLADVLPQVTSAIRASSIGDQELRRVYSETYQAFRRRRSLLLLNLESQVKIGELPWVAAIDPYRRASIENRDLATAVLEDIVCTALVHFPQAILPNTLLQELRSLAKQAELDVPFVDEVAADIFMGVFSSKFARAARLAGIVLGGSLYARYFRIDYSALGSVREDESDAPRTGLFSRLLERKAPIDDSSARVFSELCILRAGGSGRSGYSVAANGRVIEQQQILTTQNLVSAFAVPGVGERLGPVLPELAQACLHFVFHRQQLRFDHRHAALIMLKNTAYAWRQMIFFLSLLDPERQGQFRSWAEVLFRKQTHSFQGRFGPVMHDLWSSMDRESSSDPFLGWSGGQHPLMPKLS
ncbi:MAG: hypothetical protein AAF654_06800 [Myxococcota bacterium]